MNALYDDQHVRELARERRQQAASDNLAAHLRQLRRWQRRRDRADRQVRLARLAVR